jgi:hypothetical protein
MLPYMLLGFLPSHWRWLLIIHCVQSSVSEHRLSVRHSGHQDQYLQLLSVKFQHLFNFNCTWRPNQQELSAVVWFKHAWICTQFELLFNLKCSTNVHEHLAISCKWAMLQKYFITWQQYSIESYYWVIIVRSLTGHLFIPEHYHAITLSNTFPSLSISIIIPDATGNNNQFVLKKGCST